jgi:signal transduction protein with GAF and PtsI domain
LLVCPILDHDKCLGVLQCVNKLEGHFSKDDEALLLILAEFSRVVLNNAIHNDQQLLIHNKLRHTIKTGLILGEKVADITSLITTSQNRLKAMMNVEHGKVALISSEKSGVLHCSEDGRINIHPRDMGIMSEVLESGK